MLASEKDNYVRIKKLVKELNGHLKENLIAGSTELFKDSEGPEQTYTAIKRVQKEQMKVSTAKQQGEGGLFEEYRHLSKIIK